MCKAIFPPPLFYPARYSRSIILPPTESTGATSTGGEMPPCCSLCNGDHEGPACIRFELRCQKENLPSILVPRSRDPETKRMDRICNFDEYHHILLSCCCTLGDQAVSIALFVSPRGRRPGFGARTPPGIVLCQEDAYARNMPSANLCAALHHRTGSRYSAEQADHDNKAPVSTY